MAKRKDPKIYLEVYQLIHKGEKTGNDLELLIAAEHGITQAAARSPVRYATPWLKDAELVNFILDANGVEVLYVVDPSIETFDINDTALKAKHRNNNVRRLFAKYTNLKDVYAKKVKKLDDLDKDKTN